MREWPSGQEGRGHVARSHDHRDRDRDVSRVDCREVVTSSNEWGTDRDVSRLVENP